MEKKQKIELINSVSKLSFNDTFSTCCPWGCFLEEVQTHLQIGSGLRGSLIIANKIWIDLV